MTLVELYTKKGELTTSIEVAQAKLQMVNNEIVKLINEQNKPKEETTSKDN